MRLPLNTTGQLLPLTTAGVPYTVFDMASIPANLRNNVVSVTLYAITSNLTAGGPFTQDISVEVVGITASPLLVDNVERTLNAESSSIFKVINRFPLRGAGRVTVTPGLDFAVVPTYVFGFVEVNGAQDLPEGPRPLEPNLGSVGNNQDPFTYMPAYSPAGSTDLVRVHQLDPTMAHIVTLSVRSEGGGDPAPYGAQVTVVDGSSSQTFGLIEPQGAAVFEDIPFLPVDSTVGGLLPGIYLTTINANDVAAAWGAFGRG